MKLDELIKY